jgi:MYXO-CTERM domain-containing protein
MRTHALLPLLALLAGCSSEVGAASQGDPPPARAVAQRIVNGTPDTAAHDSVVFIAIGNDGAFCTGTLIAPNLVLTAHHCVADPDETQECGAFGPPHAPSTFGIFVGLQHETSVATGSKVILDTAKSNNICGNDIALIQLDRDVPNAKLSKVRLTPLVAGEAATTSGYGDDGTGNVTSGRFVKAGLEVDAVGPTSYSYKTAAGEQIPVTLPAGEIVTGESTCFGDSGGPLFDAAGNVIGMTSRGVDEKCNDRPSIYTDTASHAAVITAAAVAAGHPLPAADLPARAQSPSSTPESDATDTSTNDPDTTDTEEDPAPKPAKKKKSSIPAGAAAGCSAAPTVASSSSLPMMLGLALAAAVVRRRRRPRAQA